MPSAFHHAGGHVGQQLGIMEPGGTPPPRAVRQPRHGAGRLGRQGSERRGRHHDARPERRAGAGPDAGGCRGWGGQPAAGAAMAAMEEAVGTAAGTAAARELTPNVAGFATAVPLTVSVSTISPAWTTASLLTVSAAGGE